MYDRMLSRTLSGSPLGQNQNPIKARDGVVRLRYGSTVLSRMVHFLMNTPSSKIGLADDTGEIRSFQH